MVPVHDLFADWPRAFDRNVDKRLNSGPQKFNSAPARLGKWFHRLRSFHVAAFDPLQERVGKTVGRVFGVSYAGALTPDEAREWISAANAAKLLRFRVERLVSAVSTGAVKGRLQHSGHRHTTIPMDEVDLLRDLRARFVFSNNAGEFLGVAKKQFSLLIECGFIQTASGETKHPLVDGSVDLPALIALVDGIRDEIAPAPPNGRAGALSRYQLALLDRSESSVSATSSDQRRSNLPRRRIKG